MASKQLRSIASLFEAHKRLKLDPAAAAGCSSRLLAHNEVVIEPQQKSIQISDARVNTDAQQRTLSSGCSISHETPAETSTLKSDTHINLNPNVSASNPLCSEQPGQEKKMRMELNSSVATAIPDVSPSTPICTEELSQEQKMRMELNKSAATAIPNASPSSPLCTEELSQEQKLQMELNKSVATAIPNVSPSSPLCTEELSQEQKMRMELNKSVANAIRNVKKCEEGVLESRAQGVPFPEFKSVLVEQKWSEFLSSEFGKTYMEKLYHFVKEEVASGFPIYPPPAKVFNAFNTCPFEKVKVVIIGQDPYHGPGQAMGLCFSVEEGVTFPSSLLNIFKEVQDDTGCSIPLHGNLEKWSYQGVLLLNTVLTVQGSKANSHAKKGWEEFTDAAIKAVALHRSGVVFLLWGNSAQKKTRLINQNAHHILKAAHPSGLSAHRGFFKCKHFSQTNKILEKQGLLPIDWQI